MQGQIKRENPNHLNPNQENNVSNWNVTKQYKIYMSYNNFMFIGYK